MGKNELLKPLLLIVLLQVSGLVLSQQQDEVEILWDNYGVPHIFANNKQDMYYAFGWAQMNNHADLILKLYAQARGNAAEYWGEEYLNSDKLVHLFSIQEKANAIYQKQGIEYKQYLDAFVNGINAYAKANPQGISERFKQVFPITAVDVISHTLRIICLEFIAKEDIYYSYKLSGSGSNAIAIAPSKSASKNAMLVINPHLPWSDYFLWFESHLNTNGFNFYGISLIGMPSVNIGFNENLGWTHTINPIDVSDRYELTLKGDGYILDGKTMAFASKKVSIKVKQKDGSLAEEKLEFKYSQHGPVVGQKDDKAYAVKIAGLENSGIYEQYYKMAQAKTFGEFEAALKMQQIPMFNIIYADKEGNIFYLFNGNVPIRKEGDFWFWKGTIDGTKSKYIWEKTHPYKDLPKLLNPSTGFIQNCNDAPWSCTYPTVLNPEKYPSYMSSTGTPFRPQRAINMIKDNPSITFDQLIDYKNNTGMETAERFLDDLIAAVETFPDSIAQGAIEVLKQWDKKTEVDSRGAVLFACWWDKVKSNMFEIPWSAENPVTTPDGLKEQKQAVDLLVTAAKEVQAKYGAMDIAWGDVYRLNINGIDYPANGGAGDYGIFRTLYFTDVNDSVKIAVAGETFVAVTEFGEKVRARVMLAYGNATQPGNRHIGDQLELLSGKKLREALLDREDIIKHLEKREVLTNDFK